MNQHSTNNPDKPKKSKETVIHIIIMVLFIGAIGFLFYTLTKNDDTALNNQQETVDIKVYFSRLDLQLGKENCSTVFPVTKTIPKTDALAEAALEKLFEGTTSKEIREGLHTNISPEFTIKSLTINERVAIVELHDDLKFLGRDACTATTIKTQITKTLEQFPNIDKVVITVNDKTDGL